MAESKHWCQDCQTHFGGPPNDVTPEEHIEIAHDGVDALIVVNGNWRDWERKYGGLDIDESKSMD